MTDTCAIHPITQRELAGTEPELTAASALDLSACDRLEIIAGLYEHEKAGLRFETWPPKLQNEFAAIIAQWQGRNPTRALRAQTCGVQDNACVMIIHHHEKD